MRHFEQTPVDEVSGLPLLLVPDEDILPIVMEVAPDRGEDGTIYADWNHVWHPARTVIDAGNGGPALRNSRVQLVMRERQHNEYHAYYSGPPLPLKPSGRFRASVLCAAGYIPPVGIAFGLDGPYRQQLTDWQMIRLRESGEVRVASLSVVQKFMRQFVIEQPVDHIKPRTIDRFLRIDPRESAYDAKRHAELAYLLLSLAIDRAEDPLIRPYAHAREAGLLAPNAPERPDQFILSTIVNNGRSLHRVAKDFTPKLRAYREGVLARAAPSAGALALAT